MGKILCSHSPPWTQTVDLRMMRRVYNHCATTAGQCGQKKKTLEVNIMNILCLQLTSVGKKAVTATELFRAVLSKQAIYFHKAVKYTCKSTLGNASIK